MSVDNRSKIKRTEKRDKYQDLARELKKTQKKQTREYEGDGDTNCKGSTWNNPERTGNGTDRGHPVYSMVKIRQNIENRPGDLRRLPLTQTLLRSHVNVGIKKTLKRVK